MSTALDPGRGMDVLIEPWLSVGILAWDAECVAVPKDILRGRNSGKARYRSAGVADGLHWRQMSSEKIMYNDSGSLPLAIQTGVS